MLSDHSSRLLPITTHKSMLIYDLQRLPGALNLPFAVPETVERLDIAANFLSEHTDGGSKAELLIWDAYRTRETQNAIFERYVCELISKEGIGRVEAVERASGFISDPNSVFPHGTGGAIDLTLLIGGQPASMGTDFDAFVPESALAWYRHNPPQNKDDVEAARNRELLRAAMEHAGFAGLDEEWWHYEWGTSLWAKAVGKLPKLTAVLPVPHMGSIAVRGNDAPLRQPAWFAGVAQVFPSSTSRALALFHETQGHYYARTSHPGVTALGEYLCEFTIPARHTLLTSSGLNACTVLLKSMIPCGGVLIYDRFIYYEVEREILLLASERRWIALAADFTDIPSIDALLNNLWSVKTTSLFLFCDSPRNWWLDCVDIGALAKIAHKYSGKVAVDVSVQPLQCPLQLGADAVVCSLSKYPSMGMTLGGAVFTDSSEIHSKITDGLTHEGSILSPDAATTIWTQAVSLRDRLGALSTKVLMLSKFLDNHPSVRQVRIVNAKMAGGLVGGQLTFHVMQPAIGAVAERIVGHNFLRTRSGLHLACTFGGAMTTFEHFASNTRCRTGLPRESSNEVELPPDLIRVGVGCERVDDILADLDLVLTGASLYP